MGRKIKIGYLKFLPEFKGISPRVIENNFLSLLGRYADINTIPFRKIEDIEENFKRIERYNLDYLYISSFFSLFNGLTASFWIREKLGINIPFIFYIHAIRPWINDYLYSIPFLRNDDKILAPSEYAKRIFLKLTSKFNVYVVPCCVELNLIKNNLSDNIRKDKKIITFMGRLQEEKGIGILIESLPKIFTKINNAHLNIVGPLSGGGIKDSPKSAYVKCLEKLVKKNKLGDRVTFKGVRTGLSKYKILSASDIFVNPTLAKEETFGIVNIEALACGVPVITTGWAAGREIIENNKNGYLLEIQRDKENEPHFDREQLVSLVIKVLGDKGLMSRLKRNAMMSAKKYDYHIVMSRLVTLLGKGKANSDIAKGWDFFKDKTLSDFGYIFNKKFLFFIFYERRFKTRTFSSLYNRLIKNYTDERKPPISITEEDKRVSRRSGITKKIHRDFLNFLTST